MAHVDFLAFSFPIPEGEWENDLQLRPGVLDEVIAWGGDDLDAFVRSVGRWKAGGNHRPFSSALSASECSAKVLWNHRLTHGLFEMGGTACALAFDLGLMTPILANVITRLTRIDVAIDIRTDAMPADLVAAGYSERFSSSATMNSQTGQTIYIGSRQSERFCRVYKYAEPHPRAGLLRVEFELKGAEAKRIAEAILDGSVDAVAASLVQVFGFQSDLLNAAIGEASPLPPSQRIGGKGETVRWLYTAVAPAMARLVKDQQVDVQAFLEYVFSIADEL